MGEKVCLPPKPIPIPGPMAGTGARDRVRNPGRLTGTGIRDR